MVNKIGDAAGKVWRYLKTNGTSSFAAILKGTRLKQRDADRAIGWLAREGKIIIEKEKYKELISLAE